MSAAAPLPEATEARPEPSLEPYAIRVPEALSVELDALVELFARRMGERPEEVRRVVEVAVLRRGIDRVRGEEGLR